MAKLTVTSVAAAAVVAGFVQIVVGTRATTDKETKVKKVIAPENRNRCLVIPELSISDIPTKYQQFVLGALYAIAKDQLSALWEEHGDLMREVEDSIWTVDALLAYAARKAESKKMTTEGILAWFVDSELKKYLSTKHDAAAVIKFGKELAQIAAPVIPWSEEKLLKRIVTLGRFESDALSDLGAAMIRKMSARVEAIKKERDELGSMDDMDIDEQQPEQQPAAQE